MSNDPAHPIDTTEWDLPLQLRISHKTHFHYQEFARDSYNEARLRPLDDLQQKCLDFKIQIIPEAIVRDFPDLFENHVHYFDLIQKHQDLIVQAQSIVETYPDLRGPIPFGKSLQDLFLHETSYDHMTYLGESPYVNLEPIIHDASRHAYPASQINDIWEATVAIGEYLFREIQYTPNSTTVHTRPHEVIQDKRGVCQDFAHVMLGMCRAREIPARYISGYFYNEIKNPDEVEASHAWVEVYLPDYGWQGYDPTHRRIPDTRYVKLATGIDYGSVMPISGTFRGRGTREMNVEVHIDRV